MASDGITELQRCLALVRGGMSDDAAREWLASAWAEVRHLEPRVLAMACAEARKVADRPGQILPAILNAEIVQFCRKMDAVATPFLRDHTPRRALTDQSEAQKLITDAADGIRADA